MRKIQLLLLLFISLFLLQNEAFSKTTTISAKNFLTRNFTKESPKTLSTSPVFNLDSKKFYTAAALSDKLIISDFPVANNINATVELTKNRTIVDQTTKFVTATSNGDIEVQAPVVEGFTGRIEGLPDSRVYLVYSNGMLFGKIDNMDNSSFIAPNETDKTGNTVLIVNEDDFSKVCPFNFKCYVGDNEMIKAFGGKSFVVPKIQSNKLLEVELAVETDTPFFTATGGTLAKVQTYTVALYQLVSNIYEDELNICFHLTWVKNWTNSPADPYGVNGNPYEMEPKAVAYWKSHYTGVERDLAQIVTADKQGQGGFSLFNSLCNVNYDTHQGFSFISINGFHNLPTFAFTYDVYTTAHELGHNFNAVHTHDCFWNPPIDTCFVADGIKGGCLPANQKALPNPGTIMSYCVQPNYTAYGKYECQMIFHNKNILQIRATAEAATSCVTEPPSAFISLLSPHGEEVFAPGDKITIKWLTTRINNLKIEYTSNNGSTWNEINKLVPATSNKFDWTAPDMCGNFRVRISDASNKNVADTSAKNFSILKNNTDGLVAFYPFIKNSEDAICNQHDAAATKAVLTKDRFDRDSNAYNFNGTASMKTSAFTNNFTGMTISLWFTYPSAQNQFGTLICQNYEEGGTFQYYLYNDQIGAAFWVKNGAPAQIWANKIPFNKWYHATLTVSQTEMKIYLNGVLQKTDALASPMNSSNAPIYIGSRGAKEYFKGTIDDIRIYNKVLSQSEIQYLYNESPMMPEQAELVLPEDKAKDQETALTLSWNSAKYADKYNVQLSKTNTFDSGNLIVNEQNYGNTSYDVSTLEASHTYYWRVAGVNKNGTGSWSPVFSFTTKEALVLPSQAMLIEPADKSKDLDTNLLLKWKETQNAQTYDIQVSKSSTFDVDVIVLFKKDVKDTFLFVEKYLEPGHTYYWRVEGTNAKGTGQWSQVFSFTTKEITSVDEYGNEIMMSEIYPNPVNNMAEIRLNKISGENCRLTVYNELGSQINIKLDYQANKIIFNTNILPAGNYYYKLEAGIRTETRKFVIVR